MLLLALGLLQIPPDIDVRGPILPPGRPPIVGKTESVQAAQASVAINPNDRSPGVGKWIWSSDPDSVTAIRFRKLVTLKSDPELVRGWITADVRYRMWINGTLASRGPADVGRDYDSGPCGPWLEDVRNLTRYFKQGSNIVAVEVMRVPLASNEANTDQPGLKINLKVQNKDGSTQAVGTDPTWKTAQAPDLDQNGAKRGFRFDMNLEPAGWQAASRDDSSWSFAQIAHRDQPNTLVSELAQPLEAVIPPVGVTRVSEGVVANPRTGGAVFNRDGGYSVRYGYVLPGIVGLRVRGQKGARLIIMPNERDAPGVSRQAEVILRDGVQTFELPYMDSFSVLNIKAEGVASPIEIEDVRCVFTSYPVRYLGDFSCDREDYNRIWKVGRWLTQICLQTHHLDSPNHQEPVSDSGDYLIESLNEFYAFGDGTLTRQDLKKIGRNLVQRHFQSFHTSYSLLWLRMLMQYYDYTGDAATVKELAPTVFGLLDQFESYIGPNGLISEAPNYMFMDWVDIDGFNLHHPPAVIGQGYMTAIYYRALADGIRLANMVRDQQRSSHFATLRTGVASAFERELWSPQAGLYRDGKPFQSRVAANQWLPADKMIQTFSTQVNSLAVIAGLPSSERATDVMQKVLSRQDMNCQPYFMHFVFEAMADAGLFNQEAEAQIHRWQIVPDTQSFHEMWGGGDLSHAWNSTPLFQMSGRILGVEPIEPGFARFRIQPQLCGLKWAKGRVPSPHGIIEVAWERQGGQCRLRFKVPKGTEAEINGMAFKPGAHEVALPK